MEVNKKRMAVLYYLCATKGNIDQLLGEDKLSGYFESFKDIFGYKDDSNALIFHNEFSEYEKMNLAVRTFRNIITHGDNVNQSNAIIDELRKIQESLDKIYAVSNEWADLCIEIAKVSDEDILDVLREPTLMEYAKRAAETDDDEIYTDDPKDCDFLMKLLSKVDWKMNKSGYRQLMQIDFDKSENPSEVYPCDVHIFIKWNDGDWIDDLFKLKDGAVELNKFSNLYFC